MGKAVRQVIEGCHEEVVGSSFDAATFMQNLVNATIGKISENTGGKLDSVLEEEKAVEVFLAIAAEKGIPTEFAKENDLEETITEAVRCAYVLFNTGDFEEESEPAWKKQKTGW